MRSRKSRPTPPKRDQDGGPLHHQPFRGLAPRARQNSKPAPLPPPPPPSAPELSDAEIFEREMTGVRQFANTTPSRVPQARMHTPPVIVDPDAEAMAELSDLVTGVGPFDITNTTEYIEGAVVGLDPRLVRRLRKGEFVAQSHLDLHGMVTADARNAVDQFLAYAVRRGYRCVLIIHGRGLNSVDQTPVLKRHVAAWLSHGGHARLVLAFTSARPCDGGAGAVYVLLRRQRTSKHPMRVTQGSKA